MGKVRKGHDVLIPLLRHNLAEQIKTQHNATEQNRAELNRSQIITT